MKKSFAEYRDTGTGEVGCPRPGAEGIKRVPSASSSDDRGREQVPSQACSPVHASGSRGGAETARECMEDMHLSDNGKSWGMAPTEEENLQQEDETHIVHDVRNGPRRRRLREEETSNENRWNRSRGRGNETASTPPSSKQAADGRREARRVEPSTNGQSHSQPARGIGSADAHSGYSKESQRHLY